MAHFAKVENGIVTAVIVAEQEFIDSGAVGDPAMWIQTSYNTKGGIHYDPVTNKPSADQSKALRANYAGFGYIYDAEHDVFYAPKPHPNATIMAPGWQWSGIPITIYDEETKNAGGV